jgi:error-prone DNA polymerase
MNYSKGVRETTARAIVAARPFASIQDLVDRVPDVRKDELRTLAEVGALNFINGIHRRDALWQAELAMRPAGPLFAVERADVPEPGPLARMTDSERLNTDFRRTSLTIGRHPMSFHRQRMNELGVVPASELSRVPNGRRVRTAGCVICRQRPGTAKGLVFLSVEDETGVSNAVIMPDVFAEQRATLLENAYLLIDGELQNIDNVVTVKVAHLTPLHVAEEAVPSHDFR